MTTRETNVHTEHCCKDHGCKYGSDACPVELGTLPQSFPCEACEYAQTDRAQAEIFEAARSRHDGRTVPDGQATREEVINELGALRDGLRKFAKDREAELAKAVAQGGDLREWDVETVWKAQAVALIWREVERRTRCQESVDLVDAVRQTRVAVLRELLRSRDLKRDVTSVFTQHARDEAIRAFLRATGPLVTKALGLPDVSLNTIF